MIISNSQIPFNVIYFILGFLELINNMLTSGMVPALFPDDEKDAILNQVKDVRHYFVQNLFTENDRNNFVQLLFLF